MSLRSDKFVLQTLVAAGAGTPIGNWFDLSGYSVGAFVLVVSAITGSITPAFQMSADEQTVIGAIPAGELAAPTAVSAAGQTRYPFIGPINQAWVRVSSLVVTGPVTASVFFVGRT